MSTLDHPPVPQGQIPLLDSPLAPQVLPEGLLSELDHRLQERQHMHALAKQIMARLQPGIEQLVQETVRTVLREGLQHPSSGPSD
ncbi:MAG: hypothetical protein ACKODC_02975 [Limnohabitans sp.]